MKMKKLSQTLTKYKLSILITIIFILGSYHLLMSLVKENVFNLSVDELAKTKFILIRFYHVSCMLLIGIGFSFTWSKRLNWIWLYLVFRLAYTIVRVIPSIDKMLSKTVMDGLSYGLLIIVVLMILRNEEST